MAGPQAAEDLRHFVAARFVPPSMGRYVARPARTDETGVVPPLLLPVSDPLRGRLAVAAALGLGVALWRHQQKR